MADDTIFLWWQKWYNCFLNPKIRLCWFLLVATVIENICSISLWFRITYLQWHLSYCYFIRCIECGIHVHSAWNLKGFYLKIQCNHRKDTTHQSILTFFSRIWSPCCCSFQPNSTCQTICSASVWMLLTISSPLPWIEQQNQRSCSISLVLKYNFTVIKQRL